MSDDGVLMAHRVNADGTVSKLDTVQALAEERGA